MSLLDALPKFARCNRLKKAKLIYSSGEETVDENDRYEDVGLYQDANLVTSQVMEGVHIPLIDVDMECALVPSSTPGHNHLYINKAMSFDDLIKLLEVMVEVGIVQKGFLECSRKRGFTSLRLPHIKKSDEEEALKKLQVNLDKEQIKKAAEALKAALDKPYGDW